VAVTEIYRTLCDLGQIFCQKDLYIKQALTPFIKITLMPLSFGRPNIIEQLFKPVRRNIVANPDRSLMPSLRIQTGSLISFNYTFWKNDPYPLVIVIENDSRKDKVAGINLHRLLPNDIKELMMKFNQGGYAYGAISDQKKFREAYRTYKKIGIRQQRIFDVNFLLRIISMVKTTDPAEVQIIRRQVQEQLKQQINPKASQFTNLNQAANQIKTGD